MWECLRLFGVAGSFLQTKCGILERTGKWQNRTKCWRDSKKTSDPQLAVSWQISSLGYKRSLQYFTAAWLCFTILCMFFLCRVMPVKDNGSFFSVLPCTESSRNQPGNGQRESSWSRCMPNFLASLLSRSLCFHRAGGHDLRSTASQSWQSMGRWPLLTGPASLGWRYLFIKDGLGYL